MVRNAIIRSSFWSIGGFGVSQVLRLGSNLILTRLLFPEAFGLMALVTIFLVGFELFTDLGIAASIVQSKRGEEPAFVNTAWTIKAIRGIGIAICICILAVPIASFYGEPELVAILPAMALNALFSGFASNAPALANRKLWVGRVTVMGIGCQALAIAVMVVWALLSPTVWALVAGNIVGAAATAVLSHMIFPGWRVRFQWNSDAAHEIVRFGKWVLLTSVLTFLAGQLDRLTLAKLAPLHLVGLYAIGFMWAQLPLQVVQTWMGRVLFPLAAEIFRGPEADRSRLRRYRRRAVWLSAVGVGLFGGLITPIYRLLYTPEYWPATEFLQIILAGALIRILEEPYRAFNLALGQPKYTAIGAAISILIFAAAVFPLYDKFSANGVAVAYSISQMGILVVALHGARKARLSDFSTDLAVLLVALTIWGGLYAMLSRIV